MPQRTKIEWADYSSNAIDFIIDGKRIPNLCVKHSAGCKNCYAEKIMQRFHSISYTQANIDKAQVVLNEKEIQHMLKFKPKPPFIFVDTFNEPSSLLGRFHSFKNERSRPLVFVEDMSDLFGEWMPFEMIDQLFAVFCMRPDVDWFLLTKRPERMKEYLTARNFNDFTLANTAFIKYFDGFIGPMRRFRSINLDDVDECGPLPNVILATSVSNQDDADKNIPYLLECPATYRYVSYEPAIGPVDFDPYLMNSEGKWYNVIECGKHYLSGLIIGGESGREARPCNIEWIRSAKEQCKAAGVPLFIKQLGSNPIGKLFPGKEWSENRNLRKDKWILNSKGGDMSEWPEGLRVRKFIGQE